MPIFDAEPMAEGMPPAFLLKLLKSQDAFVRHGRLMTACVWLQSQMVGVICLHSEELRLPLCCPCGEPQFCRRGLCQACYHRRPSNRPRIATRLRPKSRSSTCRASPAGDSAPANDPEKRDRLMKGLDVFLERDRDRELFDLPNKALTG